MFTRYSLLIFVLVTPSIIQCDLTNLNEFLNVFRQNRSAIYPVGFLSKANFNVVKRYLPANIEVRYFEDKNVMLNCIDNETIIGM